MPCVPCSQYVPLCLEHYVEEELRAAPCPPCGFVYGQSQRREYSGFNERLLDAHDWTSLNQGNVSLLRDQYTAIGQCAT